MRISESNYAIQIADLNDAQSLAKLMELSDKALNPEASPVTLTEAKKF